MKDRINQPFEPVPDKLGELKKFSDEQLEKYGPTNAILDESGNVIPASFMEWVFWFENRHHRVIQQDYPGVYKVSTIFEGLGSFLGFHKTLWFETMVFGPEKEMKFFGKPYIGREDLWTKRSATLKEALDVHKEGLEWLDNYLKGKCAHLP